jgi:hypothetical protein
MGLLDSLLGEKIDEDVKDQRASGSDGAELNDVAAGAQGGCDGIEELHMLVSFRNPAYACSLT